MADPTFDLTELFAMPKAHARALDAVQAIHGRRDFSNGDGSRWTECAECRQAWPCATQLAITEALEEKPNIDAAERIERLTSAAEAALRHFETSDPTGFSHGSVVLGLKAALEA